MEFVRTIKTERLMGSKVRVELEVRTTSAGQFTFPIDVDDHYSAGLTERAALEALAKFLKESLALVQRRLG